MTQPNPQAIQTYLQQNLPSYLALLKRMVEINSFTLNPAGVKALGQMTAETFAELGFTAETVPSSNPDFGEHLIMTRPGKSGRKIGLISHLDTVFPPEEEIANDFAWREAGDRIYGPGTVDIKGGTVAIYMMLAALREFSTEVFENITWVILLDACEERGGFEFGELCVAHLGTDALAALVFETGIIDNDDYLIVTARKGSARFKVSVKGKAAHAGNDHPYGANAIVQLAEVIQRIAAMTDYERELTFNVGVISGGSGTNRVPHEAEALVEMRTFDLAVYEGAIADLLALNGLSTVQSAAEGYKCEVKVELIQKTAPWSRNPATESLFTHWKQAAEQVGMSVRRQERGGLSDGNQFWQQIPTVDGIGPFGGNMHCSEQSEDGSKEQEYVLPGSLVPKTLINVMAILELVK